MEQLLGCCSCAGWDGRATHGIQQNEFQVNLSIDMHEPHIIQHPITRPDSFDITFTPRVFNGTELSSVTPRERSFYQRLELPKLHTYPVPPTCTPETAEEDRMHELLKMYQQFAFELHTGMYLLQMTSNNDYSEIHCQLMGDMQTLKLDQSNG